MLLRGKEPSTAHAPLVRMVLVLFTSIAADIVLTVAQELVKWMVSGAKWNWLNLAFILFVLCFPFPKLQPPQGTCDSCQCVSTFYFFIILIYKIVH